MKQSSSIENGNAFAIAKFADEEIVYLKKKKKRKTQHNRNEVVLKCEKPNKFRFSLLTTNRMNVKYRAKLYSIDAKYVWEWKVNEIGIS